MYSLNRKECVIYTTRINLKGKCNFSACGTSESVQADIKPAKLDDLAHSIRPWTGHDNLM